VTVNRLLLEVVALMSVAFVGAAWIVVVGSQGTASPVRAPAAVAPVPTSAAQPPPGPSLPPASRDASPETRAYLDWLTPKAQLAAESLRAIGTQSDQLAQNPVLLSDEGWKVRTATAVEILRFTGQELQAYPLPVPQAALELDGMNKEIGRDLVYVAGEYSASIDQLSVTRLKNAIDRINVIKPRAQAAMAEAEALGRQ
jgi:hypothetical protein